MAEWICGRNPVYEVLKAGRRRAHRLRVAEGVQIAGRLEQILTAARASSLPVERVPRAQLDGLSSGHQGVALWVEAYPYVDLDEVLGAAQDQGSQALVLLLDVLQDPQNLGTLLRTAEAVGAAGVVLPPRRAAGVTPAVTQAASGASEHLLIAQGNLAQAIARLQSAGIWVVGLEADPEARLPGEVPLDQPLALVVGSEGSGLRRLVRERCDLLLRLPMRGQVGSLNAAVAGSIVLYLAWQARGFDRP